MLKVNTELLANLGNFVSRSLKFLKGKFRGEVPEAVLTEVEHKLIAEVNGLLEKYVAALEAVEIREGLRLALEISRLGNLYLSDHKLDNTLFDNDRVRCGTLITISVNLVYFLASLFYPYMPASSASILQQLNAPVILLSLSPFLSLFFFRLSLFLLSPFIVAPSYRYQVLP